VIITPSQLNQRSELYHQLGVLITAGMTLHEGLEHLKANPPSRALQPYIARWLDYLKEGCTVTDALSRTGKWMPSFDLALIEAGERSGRLDACFKLLGVYYQERAQMIRQMISDLLYPLFIFHFAVVLFPFIQFVQDMNVFRFVGSILLVLAPLYAIVFFLIVACQGRHGESWRSGIEKVLRRVPFLGTARRELALARLAAALEALLNAGVGIFGAWELAATASGSPALRRTVLGWRPALEQGTTPSELVSNCEEFPDAFGNLYHTGEISGQLDQTLGRLHTMYQEQGSRRLRMVAQWAPRLIYFGIVIYIGWKILAYYSGYFSQINQIENMR
jgi:type II secretory pathway component PulF